MQQIPNQQQQNQQQQQQHQAMFQQQQAQLSQIQHQQNPSHQEHQQQQQPPSQPFPPLQPRRIEQQQQQQLQNPQLRKQFQHQQQQHLLHQQQLLHSPTFHQQQNPTLHRSSSAILAPPTLPRSATPTFPAQPTTAFTNGNRPSSLGNLESPSSSSSLHSPPKQYQSAPILQPITADHHPSAFDHHPDPNTLLSSGNNPSPSSSRHLQKFKNPASLDHHSAHSLIDSQPILKQRITEANRSSIIHWASKDQAHETCTLNGRRQKRTIFATSYGDALNAARSDWLGEVAPNRSHGRFRLQMPIDHDRAATNGKRKSRPQLKLSKQDLRLISNTEEVLVPIRLEIEVEHWKLRDTFTWNLKEPVVTPEQFAIHLCEDLILPIQHFSAPIVSAIKEQLEEYKLHQNFEGHLASHTMAPEEELVGDDVKMENSHHPQIDPDAITDHHQKKEEVWWASWRDRILKMDQDCSDDKPDLKELPPDSKRIKLDNHLNTPTLHQASMKSRLIDDNDQDFRPEPAESINISMDMRDDELRIPINLDIISGNIHLTDRFEWEISEINNSPEEFVEIYANDLGLGGEFKTAIAHSIREQIETYVKSLALVEHVNGFPVPNDELRYAFLQRVTEPIRIGQVDDFTPFLNLLNAEELDRQEKEHDREARRKRRQTRSRRGITLPDRESQRTVRSIVPIQGLKMVLPYQNDNEDVIMPIQPVAEPFAIEESAVEIPEPSELPPKRHIPASKEVQVPDSQSGTPNKATTASRVSRRLRGATADVAPSGTPPKTSEANATADKEDAPTPSNAGTPVPCPTTKKTISKPDSSTNASASKKPPAAGSRTRGTNWESMGLHDPMVDGVWHCSNCGCPEQIAVGRRKGLGGKDTLCGECGRYLHRYKRNRPTIYNTSADYHTSLKLEAEKAKKAIADQAIARKDKNKADNSNPPASLIGRKRKKEGRANLLLKSGNAKRSEERAASVASSNKSAASRDSSPVVSVRSTNNGGSEKPLSKKRSRIHGSSEAPTTRAQRNISKSVVVDSPETGNSPESNSPTNLRSQTTSGSQATKPARVSSRRNSTKTEKAGAKKNLEKNEGEPERAGSDSPPVMGTRKETRKRKELRSKEQSEKVKKESKSPEQVLTPTQLPPGSRPGSISSSVAGGEPRRSMTNGRVPPPIGIARKVEPPQWMSVALQTIKSTYPSDRVDLVPKPKRDVLGPGQPPVIVGYDWRLKCFDCPGKLYTVGPGESFSNFDVHLRNRIHRQKVDERLGVVPRISPTASSHNQPEISPTGSSNNQPQGSASTSAQHPSHQVSPTNGFQPPQVSPIDGVQPYPSQMSPTSAEPQLGPTENSQQAQIPSNGCDSQVPSQDSRAVFNLPHQPVNQGNGMDTSEAMPFGNMAHTSGGSAGLPHSLQLPSSATSPLPPITTTLAAAESVATEKGSLPQPSPHVGDGEERVDDSFVSAGRETAPSSIDGVALQDDYSGEDTTRREDLQAIPTPTPNPELPLRSDPQSSQDYSQDSHELPSNAPQPFPQAPPSGVETSKHRLAGPGVGRPELPAKPINSIGDAPGLMASGFGSSGPAHFSAGLPSSRASSFAGLPHGPHPPHPNHHHQQHHHHHQNHTNHPNHHHYIHNEANYHGFNGHGNPHSGGNPGLSSSANPAPPPASHPVPIRHPPPQPLVHPLPKKPTFD